MSGPSQSNPPEVGPENIDPEPSQVTHLSRAMNIGSSIYSSLRWCPTSKEDLAKAESELLSVLTRPFKDYFVNIGPGWGRENNRIRTIEMLTNGEIKERSEAKNTTKKVPVVMIHGFAAGVGTWILNMDTLATTLDRKIYAFDMIGFGRSARAPFNLKGDVEGQFVESIERWRQEQRIEKFIVLGHSFGGYISACYALRYPQRVAHIILADPWGVQDRQTVARTMYRFPFWVRSVQSVLHSFNPLAVLRASGPYGPRLVQKFRGDLREKFRPKLDDDCYKFLDYIYHCNAQTATGESAFKALALPYGWPKFPLIHRLPDVDGDINMTFVYGSRSWIDMAPGEFLRDRMGNERVTVNVIQGSGHHVYADKFSEFNDLVKEACSKVRDT